MNYDGSVVPVKPSESTATEAEEPNDSFHENPVQLSPASQQELLRNEDALLPGSSLSSQVSARPRASSHFENLRSLHLPER